MRAETKIIVRIGIADWISLELFMKDPALQPSVEQKQLQSIGEETPPISLQLLPQIPVTFIRSLFEHALMVTPAEVILEQISSNGGVHSVNLESAPVPT